MLRALRAAPALSRRYAGLLHSSGPPMTKPRWTKAASRRCSRPEAAGTRGLGVAEGRPRAIASRMRERPSQASSMACQRPKGGGRKIVGVRERAPTLTCAAGSLGEATHDLPAVAASDGSPGDKKAGP